MKEIELLIFDMDGLIFETGRLAYQAYIESAKVHDYEVTPNVYYYLTGRTETGIREGMKEIYGSETPYNKWRDTTNEFKQRILKTERRVYKKPGVISLLQRAKKKGIKIALASSSSRDTINHYFELEKMPSIFDVIIAGDEVAIGKPNPEIFLEACEKSGVPPYKAVVLEDSKAGIEAAKRGGITAILVEDDIMDMPSIQGKYRLKKNLSRILEGNTEAAYQFETLEEVEGFLEENDWGLPTIK